MAMVLPISPHNLSLAEDQACALSFVWEAWNLKQLSVSAKR